MGELAIEVVIEAGIVPVVEPIETADFIWTVISTVTRTEAPVIGHVVQSFGRVYCCQYGAYRFAWCMLTMLAEHRLVYHRYVLHVIQVADFIFLRIGLAVLLDRVIPVDTYPMHFPAAAYFITAYNRNIILQVTSYDAGTTARTGIEVDGHYPFVARLLVFVPQIVSFVRVSPPAGIMGRIFLVLRETRFADNVSAFDGVVGLRLGQFIRTAGFGQLRCSIVL